MTPPELIAIARALVGEFIDNVEEAIAVFNQTPDDIRRDLAVHILTTTRSD